MPHASPSRPGDPVAVLGTGRVATALAAKLQTSGRAVTLGSRDPHSAEARWSGPVVGFATYPDAVRSSAVVINATPGEHSLELLSGLRDELAGRVLLDVANAIRRDGAAGTVTLLYPARSLAEELQAALPATRVVKSLNTMLFAVMADPQTTTTPPVAFLSGDDDEAKKAATGILADLGWPAGWIQDLGGLATARATEAFMLLVPAIGRRYGMVPFALSIAI